MNINISKNNSYSIYIKDMPVGSAECTVFVFKNSKTYPVLALEFIEYKFNGFGYYDISEESYCKLNTIHDKDILYLYIQKLINNHDKI